jgi:hypothetical protein
MELTTTVVADVRTQAVLTDDGTLTVTVSGSAEYRKGRTAGDTITVTDEALLAPLRAGLKAIQDASMGTMSEHIAQAVFSARAVAAARNER